MNKYRKLSVIYILAALALVLAANIYILKSPKYTIEKEYKVEVERIASRLGEGESLKSIDLANYPDILSVEKYNSSTNYSNEYMVKEAKGQLYVFFYERPESYKELYCMDFVLALMIMVMLFLFLYLDRKILSPFYRIEGLAQELAKGNLTVPIKQEKSKYLKNFLWSLDMLRQKLEEDRQKEYALIKENKTMVLSLSHDIKTPLSAIDLYAMALKKNIYDNEADREKAIEGIESNVSLMKDYVGQIADSQRENFLALETNNQEFYMSQVIDGIREYYEDKCRYLHVKFDIEKCPDNLLYGDSDRLLEVLQNIMENAIKYGDGRWISMSFSQEENYRLITVSNSGEAMKEEELPHIFESFYRGSNSTKAQGSGLGLYIAKSLMRKMEGDIFVKQEKGGNQQEKGGVKRDLQLKSGESLNCFQVTLVVKMA